MKAKEILQAAITTLFVLAAMACSFMAGHGIGKARRADTSVRIDTLWVRDTVRLLSEAPAETVLVRLPVVHDTIRVTSFNLSEVDNIVADSAAAPPVPDSATVAVPIVSREYIGENYRAVVRGYRPELVSMEVRLPQVQGISVSSRKRWTVTIGPQVGFGFTPAGWQPYAGVGVSAGWSF